MYYDLALIELSSGAVIVTWKGARDNKQAALLALLRRAVDKVEWNQRIAMQNIVLGSPAELSGPIHYGYSGSEAEVKNF